MQIILLEKVVNLGNLGDIVKVKVLEVDVSRQRISLSMKTDSTPSATSNPDKRNANTGRDNRPRGGGSYTAAPQVASGSAMASAFAKFQGLKK